MPKLVVHDLDEEVIEALKRAAATNGRSAEAEHREILRTHLATRPKKRTFKEALSAMPYFDDDGLFDAR